MKTVVNKEANYINFNRLKSSDISELVFEDKENWFIEYDKLAIVHERQMGDDNNCHSYFKDNSIGVLESGRIKLDLTDDGKENMRLLRSFRSTKPDYQKEGVFYKKLVKA